MIKQWLENNENMEYLKRELDLFLCNNHGAKICYNYKLLSYKKCNLDNFRELTLSECKELKEVIKKDIISIIQYSMAYEDIEVDIQDIMKVVDFKKIINIFVNELEGEKINIDKMKKII